LIVWGYLLSGPLILTEQFWMAGRTGFLTAGETLWYGYAIGWILVGLGFVLRLRVTGLLIPGMYYISWLLCPLALLVLIDSLIYRKSVECWWTNYLGCLSVMITSAQCVYTMYPSPFLF
jgi:surface polysaccharide O-acyltransferase-like enzyme